MSLRIGIAGIAGRMGRLLVEEGRTAGAVVAGGIARPGSKTAPDGVALLPDIAALFAASDVVIDFSHAHAAGAHAAAADRPFVLGTSGLSDADEAAVRQAASRAPVVYAANFAPGAALVFALAERMAAALPADTWDAEIVEMHHRQKVDAPSGTALAIARAVARGRGTTLVTESGRHGHTGPRAPGAVGLAALRGGQVVGEHTLIFASATEQIRLESRFSDRRAFATGAVQAALWAVGKPPGLYDMADVLGMR